MHPQQWPADLDYAGKRVVVIGSGATAVTMVPAMAETAAHVTMLQRSPTYILSAPTEDVVATKLRALLGPRRAYAITRWKNVAISTLIYQLSQRRPEMMRRFIRTQTVKQLPEGYDVDTHFNPAYGPWDQRLCLVPDADLFRSLRAGDASVVTDHIDRFTPGGIRLTSGAELPADIVVTATGLRLLALGAIELTVDGRTITPPDTMAYKGMMLGGVPNFAFTIGYTNASWTLKADLVGEFVCRLLRHMDAHGYDHCTPWPDPAVTETPPAGLPGRIRPAGPRPIPQGRVPGAVAAGHELRPGRPHPPARADRGRRSPFHRPVHRSRATDYRLRAR